MLMLPVLKGLLGAGRSGTSSALVRCSLCCNCCFWDVSVLAVVCWQHERERPGQEAGNSSTELKDGWRHSDLAYHDNLKRMRTV